MPSFSSRIGVVLILMTFPLALALGKNPTFSLEAIAINDVSISGGPTSKVSIAPGATVTFEVLVRDWSPDGEPLRAYQAQLDVDGYTSGLAGTLKPADFDETTVQEEENRENCTVDMSHPKFVFRGRPNMGLADTRSHGYRWLGMVLHDKDAIVCDQSGKKYYCGMVRLKASADAQGTFRPRLLPGQAHTTLRDPMTLAILPVDIEDAFVEIIAGKLAIVSSEPPQGAIDSRTTAAGRGGGWDEVSLMFNLDTGSLTGADFDILDGTADPPRIEAWQSEGSVIRLKLSRGMSPGRWTSIVHRESTTSTRIGRLPGDANRDGELSTRDVLDVLDSISDGAAPRHLDMDDNGRTDLTDALTVLEVLTRPGAYRAPRLERLGK